MGCQLVPRSASPFLPLSLTSTLCLLHLLGEQLVTDLPGVVPLGRIHPAASLKSLSTRLLSFHLGRLPRVAARQMGEVMGSGETMFYEQLNFYVWLTVVHVTQNSSASQSGLAICLIRLVFLSLIRNKTETHKNS